MTEAMCNEILGNYTKKEDQLMTAAFGTRPKRRLNRVMDALKFEYPNYERLSKGAEGPKRKSVVSVMKRQATRMIEEDKKALKKKKSIPELKVTVPKKRKVAAVKPKTTDLEEEIPSTPPAADVEEILKVMTESLPLNLSPLGPQLMKLLQKKEEPATIKKPAEKRRRIITIIDAIEETPPSASASETPPAKAAPTEATTDKATASEATNLEGAFFDIDKMILDMATEETVATAEETLAPVPGKGEKVFNKEKKITEDILEEEDFNFQNMIGQELSKTEKEELRDYAISCGYQPGALLFGGVDEESLGCLRDRTGAKVVSTLLKSVGFPKLESELSRYRRQHIVGSLFYSNFKVKFLP
jgi:hypothetical protein